MAARAETATATPTRVATATRRAAPRRRRIRWGAIVTHGVLLTACAVILFPLVWVLLLSVKSLPDAYTNRIWPHHFDFGSYHRALTSIDTLPQNFENSIIVNNGYGIEITGGYTTEPAGNPVGGLEHGFTYLHNFGFGVLFASGLPPQTNETDIEFNHQIQITPYLYLRPNL